MTIRTCLRTILVAGLAWLALGESALAWTRPGHMVSAAIAYREVMRTDPAAVTRILAIMAAHPEPAPFEVAIGRTTGEARAQRIFLEMARWSDDTRGSHYDHPTWHYLLRPLVDPATPPPSPPWYATSGNAVEALALNIAIARNPRASDRDRAVALCWIFHIVGDVHQPLHAAELFSRALPQGDFGGDRIYLIDPESGAPVKLHWYWDDAVSQLAEPDAALARADELISRFPRSAFSAELKGDIGRPPDVAVWSQESFEVARTLGLRADGPRALSPETALRPSPAYAAARKAAAEQRLTLSGYRLAEVIRTLFPAP